jgi:hypothetical protein
MKMLENNPEMRKKHGMTKAQAEEYTESNKDDKSYKNLREKVKKK